MLSMRLMTDRDLPMLHGWLNRPHIAEWWGGEEDRPSLADVENDYAPSSLNAANVTPYIITLNNEPIGYAQSYIAKGSGDGYWEEITDPGVRGIDQLLANSAQLNKGLGTQMVVLITERLFADPKVTMVQTDPSPDNLRAIRCYEKAGFIQRKTITTPDGPAIYMTQTREDFDKYRKAKYSKSLPI